MYGSKVPATLIPEHAFLLCKPDAQQHHRTIIQALDEAGFHIHAKCFTFSTELAEEIAKSFPAVQQKRAASSSAAEQDQVSTGKSCVRKQLAANEKLAARFTARGNSEYATPNQLDSGKAVQPLTSAGAASRTREGSPCTSVTQLDWDRRRIGERATQDGTVGDVATLNAKVESDSVDRDPSNFLVSPSTTFHALIGAGGSVTPRPAHQHRPIKDSSLVRAGPIDSVTDVLVELAEEARANDEFGHMQESGKLPGGQRLGSPTTMSRAAAAQDGFAKMGADGDGSGSDSGGDDNDGDGGCGQVGGTSSRASRSIPNRHPTAPLGTGVEEHELRGGDRDDRGSRVGRRGSAGGRQLSIIQRVRNNSQAHQSLMKEILQLTEQASATLPACGEEAYTDISTEGPPATAGRASDATREGQRQGSAARGGTAEPSASQTAVSDDSHELSALVPSPSGLVGRKRQSHALSSVQLVKAKVPHNVSGQPPQQSQAQALLSSFQKMSYDDFLSLNAKHLVGGGTCLALALTAPNAVEWLLELVGPENPIEARVRSPNSLRARFGTDLVRNAVHAAANLSEAGQLIRLVFGLDLGNSAYADGKLLAGFVGEYAGHGGDGPGRLPDTTRFGRKHGEVPGAVAARLAIRPPLGLVSSSRVGQSQPSALLYRGVDGAPLAALAVSAPSVADAGEAATLAATEGLPAVPVDPAVVVSPLSAVIGGADRCGTGEAAGGDAPTECTSPAWRGLGRGNAQAGSQVLSQLFGARDDIRGRGGLATLGFNYAADAGGLTQEKLHLSYYTGVPHQSTLSHSALARGRGAGHQHHQSYPSDAASSGGQVMPHPGPGTPQGGGRNGSSRGPSDVVSGAVAYAGDAAMAQEKLRVDFFARLLRVREMDLILREQQLMHHLEVVSPPVQSVPARAHGDLSGRRGSPSAAHFTPANGYVSAPHELGRGYDPETATRYSTVADDMAMFLQRRRSDRLQRGSRDMISPGMPHSVPPPRLSTDSLCGSVDQMRGRSSAVSGGFSPFARTRLAEATKGAAADAPRRPTSLAAGPASWAPQTSSVRDSAPVTSKPQSLSQAPAHPSFHRYLPGSVVAPAVVQYNSATPKKLRGPEEYNGVAGAPPRGFAQHLNHHSLRHHSPSPERSIPMPHSPMTHRLVRQEDSAVSLRPTPSTRSMQTYFGKGTPVSVPVRQPMSHRSSFSLRSAHMTQMPSERHLDRRFNSPGRLQSATGDLPESPMPAAPLRSTLRYAPGASLNRETAMTIEAEDLPHILRSPARLRRVFGALDRMGCGLVDCAAVMAVYQRSPCLQKPWLPNHGTRFAKSLQERFPSNVVDFNGFVMSVVSLMKE